MEVNLQNSKTNGNRNEFINKEGRYPKFRTACRKMEQRRISPVRIGFPYLMAFDLLLFRVPPVVSHNERTLLFSDRWILLWFQQPQVSRVTQLL